jgi:hypothetical protein
MAMKSISPPLRGRTRNHPVDLGRLASRVERACADPGVRPLEGHHLALLVSGGSAHQSRAAQDALDAVERCARAIGAKVARLPVILPFRAESFVLLPRLYELIYCDRSLAGLSPLLRQMTGLPVVSGLWDPWHATALLALLLSIRAQAIPAGQSIDLVCRHPDHEPAAKTLVAAAARLKLTITPVEPSAQAVSRRFRLETDGEGYAGWKLHPAAGCSWNSMHWQSCVSQFREAAVQAALLQAIDDPLPARC